MRNAGTTATLNIRQPVPRGIRTTGPAILSYGFRPFFLLAGLFAIFVMVTWILALSGAVSVGGEGGPIVWHAHEMLFGYGAAALCGFVLTAVPNWTGRLPVSGWPLAGLVALWLAGRVVSLAPEALGETPSAAIDTLFLLILAFVVGREVVIARNTQNIRVAAAIATLAALNTGLHLAVLLHLDTALLVRLTVALLVLLVCNIGGRIVPSFTRNYLARQGATKLPKPKDLVDSVALGVAGVALLLWSIFPEGSATAATAAIAAVLHAVRLARWRGWAAMDEPLVLVLHLAYAFVPLGLLSLGGAAMGLIAQPSALHVLTVGVIGLMTLAVMTRATRGHTGRPLSASLTTTIAYGCLVLATLVRPAAELVPDAYHWLLAISAGSWILAFMLFTLEHAPMLLRRNVRNGEPS